jgi:hypothetical protein
MLRNFPDILGLRFGLFRRISLCSSHKNSPVLQQLFAKLKEIVFLFISVTMLEMRAQHHMRRMMMQVSRGNRTSNARLSHRVYNFYKVNPFLLTFSIYHSGDLKIALKFTPPPHPLHIMQCCIANPNRGILSFYPPHAMLHCKCHNLWRFEINTLLS